MSDTLSNILSPHFPSVEPTGDWRYLIDLAERQLQGRNFFGGAWNDLNLSGRYFDYSDFHITRLVSCNFHGARFKGGFDKCKCEGTDFSSTLFQRETSNDTVFLVCSFKDSTWEESYSFINCLFIACDLTDLVVDTNRSFIGTIFIKCAIPADIAKRLKMLDAAIID